MLLYIMAIWDQGLFYNVPYFRLGLTAFYGPPAVHLHVAGRQERCIIMSFPAPKCYFTGRGSFLKLHHFYNFPNFYFRHYYQQDFITYLECKQVWVMTSPPPPTTTTSTTTTTTADSFPLMAPAAISDAQVQTGQTSARVHVRVHKKRYSPNVQPLQAAWPRCGSKAVIYKCVRACMYVLPIKRVKGGRGGVGVGGWSERFLYSTHINHVGEKWANVPANSSSPHPEKMKFTGIPIKTAIIPR